MAGRIWLDLDDVVFETARTVAEHFGLTEAHVHDCRERRHHCLRAWGYDCDTVWRAAETLIERGLPWVPGAFAGLCALRRAGHRLSVLTARRPETIDRTIRNLGADAALLLDDVIHCGRLDAKAAYVRDGDVLIDDMPHEALIAADQQILYRRPWNRAYQARRTAADWPAIVAHLTA